MTQVVEFFAEDVTCLHCNEPTRGLIYEHSGEIVCCNCNKSILDASDVDGGTVVILQLDDDGMMH